MKTPLRSYSRNFRNTKPATGLLGRLRRGTATIELAVCLPILFLFSLGAMEAASMIFLRQALVQSAYETVKESVRSSGSQSDGLIRGQQVLDFRNIDDHSITFDPANVDDLEPGELVTVTVTAPGDSNSVFPFRMFQNRLITVEATMLKRVAHVDHKFLHTTTTKRQLKPDNRQPTDDRSHNMNLQQPHRTNIQRRGAMLPMVAITIVVLFIGVVFSIEIAYMHMVRAELRTATDAAARAGAETLARTQDREAAITAALAVANLNNVAGDGLQLDRDAIEVGSTDLGRSGKFEFIPNLEPLTSVRVLGDRKAESPQGSVPLFFGRLLGQADFEPIQTATASSSVRDIALVLDRSGSMATVENGVSRIDALKAAVQVFIDEVNISSPNAKISLTTYSTTSTRDIPLTSNFGSIQNQVNNLPAQGFTNIFEALRDGSDSLIQDPGRRRFASKTVVLMTDGNFNVGGTPVPSATLAASRGQQIHTITFSSGANQAIMKDVAQIGSGTHIHADQASDLPEAFREIARTFAVFLSN